ncbi:unnamed protein product [Linum trigynum]|uniref:Non-haem dioxygenase N-terminal domain-containing protein n=1 Tax=Linum trigynum TaxID=586398 RepID=A0AAV2EZZ9_9ROSI
MESINEAPASDLKLPFIDFSSEPDLKQGTHYWDSLKSQVREALEDYGCFEASFDRVPSRLRTDVFGSLEDLFDLPLPTKQGSTLSPRHISEVTSGVIQGTPSLRALG